MKYEFRIEPVITPEIGYTVAYGWFPNCAWDLVSAPHPPPQREGFFRTKEEAQRAIDHLKGGADCDCNATPCICGSTREK